MKIDIHSHIIYDIDDGAIDLVESVQMLEAASSAGIACIVATPHYLEGVFDLKEYDEKFGAVSEKANEIGLVLIKGAEIQYNDDLLHMEISKLPLIGTSYAFISPMTKQMGQLEVFLQKLIDNGITPILSHIERYNYLAKNSKLLKQLKKNGCKFQVNSGSLIGVYGNNKLKYSKRLMKKGLIDYVATGSHSFKGYLDPYDIAYQKAKKLLGREKAYRLFEDNPSRLIHEVTGKKLVYSIGGISVD